MEESRQPRLQAAQERLALVEKAVEYRDYAKRVTDDYYKLAKRLTFFKSCFLFVMSVLLAAAALLAVATPWGWAALVGVAAINLAGNSFMGARAASCWSWGGMWGGIQWLF